MDNYLILDAGCGPHVFCTMENLRPQPKIPSVWEGAAMLRCLWFHFPDGDSM